MQFDQIQVRETELPELKHLMDEIIPCQVKVSFDLAAFEVSTRPLPSLLDVSDSLFLRLLQGGTDTSQGKVNILLQAYISKAYVEDFALVSDTGFVQQVRSSRSVLPRAAKRNIP